MKTNESENPQNSDPQLPTPKITSPEDGAAPGSEARGIHAVSACHAPLGDHQESADPARCATVKRHECRAPICLTQTSPEQWRQRAALLKEAEWEISLDLLDLGRSLLAAHDPEEGPGAALRVLEGGSKFGRLATNMEKWDAADTAPVTAPDHEWQKGFAASVDRVYGRLARKEKLP